MLIACKFFYLYFIIFLLLENFSPELLLWYVFFTLLYFQISSLHSDFIYLFSHTKLTQAFSCIIFEYIFQGLWSVQIPSDIPRNLLFVHRMFTSFLFVILLMICWIIKFLNSCYYFIYEGIGFSLLIAVSKEMPEVRRIE